MEVASLEVTKKDEQSEEASPIPSIVGKKRQVIMLEPLPDRRVTKAQLEELNSGRTERMNDLGSPSAAQRLARRDEDEARAVAQEIQDAMEEEVTQHKMEEERDRLQREAEIENEEKLAEYRKHRKEKREALLLYDHDGMKKLFKNYYKIDSLDAPLDSEKVNEIMVDIFDDLCIINKIMRDDKRGKYSDAWEFGVGVVFGILILIGSIFIAVDAGKENPILCETAYSSNAYKTTCDRAKNMIGASGMLMTGAWIVVVGSLGFILVVLWRVIVKIRLSRKHSTTLLQLFTDITKGSESDKVDRIEGTGFFGMIRKKSNQNLKKDAKSRYYHAPRSAHQRVARGYGSPLMC